MLDANALKARQVQWDRFHEWEATLREHTTVEAAWRWYQEFWALARQSGAIRPREVDLKRIAAKSDLHSRLARLC